MAMPTTIRKELRGGWYIPGLKSGSLQQIAIFSLIWFKGEVSVSSLVFFASWFFSRGG